jgi:cytoplasmic iron level regulating protein YaaA (DUF328/UPF0246 family)
LLVLLPPSEGKTAPRRGKTLDLAALAYADELTDTRVSALDALAVAAGRPDALDVLGLSEGQRAEAERDARLRDEPTARASAVYTGVLYEHLGLADLRAPARRRVLIFSALWGVVRPDDRIPAYKLAAGVKLPGLGGLPALWRPVLKEALPDSGLVVDLRSGSYTSMWAPKDAAVVSVRGFTAEGKVISHMVKATRGDVARLVLSAERRPRTPEDVAELVAASGRDVALHEDRGGWTLDVTER